MIRELMIGVAGAIALSTAAPAQDWKAKFPELVFGAVPAENAAGVSDRFAPFIAYLSKQLGSKVTLRIANDYAAVIEGSVREISISPITVPPLSLAPA
jgi:phosphonate transport system substrate-binding protein